MQENKQIKEFKKIKFFKHYEFDSPDVKNSGLLMDINFVRGLDLASLHAGIPFIIRSGYRTKAHNKIVGGVANSSHLKGVAVDISCLNSEQRYIIVKSLLMVGFNRIGIGKNFVHVDLDQDKPQNVIWHYYKS